MQSRSAKPDAELMLDRRSHGSQKKNKKYSQAPVSPDGALAHEGAMADGWQKWHHRTAKLEGRKPWLGPKKTRHCH
jgi:hypothetical protein